MALYRRSLMALALCAALPRAVADARKTTTPAVTASHSYVTAASEYEWVAIRVPRPSELMGSIAARAVTGLRKDAAAADTHVAGSAPPGLPPPDWHVGGGGAVMTTGAAPFGAPRVGRERCDCATVVGDPDTERVAALYATRTFTVGAEIDDLAVLELRARYRDGIVVHVNGREVVRRAIDPDAPSVGFARRAHGPEWETFYIPVTPGLLVRGVNRLAVEVRPSALSLAPALDLTLSASRGGRLVRGPMVQRVGTDSATIAFDTDVPVRGRVEYGATPQLGRAAVTAEGGLAVHHEVALSGLAPGQPVHYRVVAGGDATPVRSFHLAPAPGEVLRFAVYGDVRGGHRTHADIVAAMVRDAPDMVLVTGDMVLRGSDEADWQRFFDVTGELLARIPYYPVAGNHDLGRTGDERRRMNEVFALWPAPEDRPEWGHWYSFRVGDTHFVMLDSNSYEHEEQLAWVERDLAAARASGARAIFALTHDGPWSRGIHRGNRYAAANYAPVLNKYDVTLVLSGHDHLYQRGEVDGLPYVVSGGGGAPLYSVRCGIPGKPRCSVDDGMEKVSKTHHYIIITVYPRYVEMCPKLADGTALEACVKYRLR